MALDFQQVYAKIKEIGASVQQRKKTLDERRAKARTLLNNNANLLDALREKLETVKAVDPAIRCALPLKEALDSHLPPPALPLNATLIAADGSQINPDRHGQVQFCVVNIGSIVIEPNSGNSSQVKASTDLYLGDDLFEGGELLSESVVALRRDVKERGTLLELAKTFSGTIITLTDGPLGLWEAKDAQASAEYGKSLGKYLQVLTEMEKKGVITAGYVDKPGSNLVIRLLEIVSALEGSLDIAKAIKETQKRPPLQGVTDRWLYKQILEYGERSAIFSIQSKNAAQYDGSLAVNFFYLNVGSKNGPVRVEIPTWVAQDFNKVNSLHQYLLKQCEIMGDSPYPYILHRAHEIAVVTGDERSQVEQIILHELRSQGIEFDNISDKSSAKIASKSRKRFHL